MNKNNDILISIIIPVYNNEKWLYKCFDSIVNQNSNNYEVILIDDGSTDSSGKICDNYAKKYNFIRVFHKENGGHTSARKLGLTKAKGEYIGFVDSDDWVSENYIRELTTILDKYKNLDMIFFNHIQIYNNHKNEYKNHYKGYKDTNYIKNYLYEILFYNYKINEKFCNWTWGSLVKKELLHKHFVKDTNILIGEDKITVNKCLYYSKNVYFLDKTLYYYNRCSDGSITADNNWYVRPNFLKYAKNKFSNDINILHQIDCYYLSCIEACFFLYKIQNKVNRKQIIKELLDDPDNILEPISNMNYNNLMHFNLKFLLWCLRTKNYKFYIMVVKIYNKVRY